MILLALAACSHEPGSAAGSLVDARTGAPAANVAIALVSSEADCPVPPIQTDADGRWSVTGLCSQATWTVTVGDPDWYLPEAAAVGPDVLLRAWRAPPDAGVYLASATAVTPLVTHTAVDVVHLFGTDREVRFPAEIPGVLPRIDADTALLLVGDVLGDTPRFEPLVPSPERRWFGTKDAPQPIDPWVYLGLRFTSDTEAERVEATVDTAHVERVAGPRPLRYIGAAALAPGRYALLTEDTLRAFLLDFGAAP